MIRGTNSGWPPRTYLYKPDFGMLDADDVRCVDVNCCFPGHKKCVQRARRKSGRSVDTGRIYEKDYTTIFSMVHIGLVRLRDDHERGLSGSEFRFQPQGRRNLHGWE